MAVNQITPETAALGAAILDNDAAAAVFGDLSEEDIQDPELRPVFAAVKDIWQKAGRLDLAMVAQIQNRETAVFCAETVPAINKEAVGQYVKAVAEAAIARRVQSIALSMATGEPGLEELQEKTAALMQAMSGKRSAEWLDLNAAFIDFYRRQRGAAPSYIKCGYPKLDRYTFLEPGDMIVIGARPSNGKTMSSLNLAIGWASKGYTVAYFSLETSGRKLFDRALACWAGIDLAEIKNGEVPTDDAELMGDCANFCKLPLRICDAAGRSVGWMRAQAARVGAKIAVVDYLQIVDGPGKTPYEQVTNISKQLHTWAQVDKVMVVALAQLSRSGANAPKLTDLRESGQIEQDADLILLLHREVDEETKEVVSYTWDIAKNKEGECGSIRMSWDGAHQMVREITFDQ